MESEFFRFDSFEEFFEPKNDIFGPDMTFSNQNDIFESK